MYGMRNVAVVCYVCPGIYIYRSRVLEADVLQMSQTGNNVLICYLREFGPKWKNKHGPYFLPYINILNKIYNNI
jgi:hypothetical protein